MRIIEPHQLHQRPKERKRYSRRGVVLLLLVVISSGAVWQAVRSQPTPPPAQAIESQPKPPPQPPRYRSFTGVQFRDLYRSFAFADTAQVTASPAITGNTQADKRIRTIAEQRGYVLSRVPSAALHKTPEGFLVQEEVLKPWQQLKDAAAKEGVNIGLVSAYRSVEEQRLIFMQELQTKGMSVEQVAAGQADIEVDAVLQTSSIPGYSRHHTGYAVDLKCGSEDFNFFANTTCFQWLSRNNYQKAKKFGWIPSYPPDVQKQGPDPEAWEYVWVGTQSLLE